MNQVRGSIRRESIGESGKRRSFVFARMRYARPVLPRSARLGISRADHAPDGPHPYRCGAMCSEATSKRAIQADGGVHGSSALDFRRQGNRTLLFPVRVRLAEGRFPSLAKLNCALAGGRRSGERPAKSRRSPVDIAKRMQSRRGNHYGKRSKRCVADSENNPTLESRQSVEADSVE